MGSIEANEFTLPIEMLPPLITIKVRFPGNTAHLSQTLRPVELSKNHTFRRRRGRVCPSIRSFRLLLRLRQWSAP